MRLILGSSSKYRKKILEDASLNFLSKSPNFDEESFKNSSPALTPKQLCEALALGKAQSLKEEFKGDIIIGSDQLIDLDGEILGKSHSAESAFRQLKKMSGKTHLLHTSMALIGPGGDSKVLTTTTEVTFRDLKDSEIQNYISIEKPFDCAGSYKMERAGLFLAKSIKGTDPMAVQGFSLIDLTTGLKSLGLSYEQFWKGL